MRACHALDKNYVKDEFVTISHYSPQYMLEKDIMLCLMMSMYCILHLIQNDLIGPHVPCGFAEGV